MDDACNARWVKYGAFVPNDGTTCTGMVLRDHEGGVIFGAC